jgi:acyl-CoA reductase-like NAD-dependent aldehyde dehydrogenase
MTMLIGGTWQAAANGRTEDVTSPFDGTVTGTVPLAGPDDVRAAVDRAESGFISVQRVIPHPAVAADFLDALVPKVEAITTGDPGSLDTTMGTLITTDEAERVEETIRRAVDEGARLLTGGGRDGAIVAPAAVAGVDPRSAVAEMTDVKTVILHGRPWRRRKDRR